jgi:hypothetical protein
MKIKYFFILLSFFAQSAVAQVYPFIEDFNTMTPYLNPTGWTTSEPGFLIYPDHGDGSQGMAALLSASTIQEDSVVSPLIGPVTATSVISFQFRIMDSIGYPCCGHIMTYNDAIDFYATSGPLSLLLFTVDSTNHVPDTAFTTFTNAIGGLAGQVGKLMIKVRRGSGEFYVDFDNISIADASSVTSHETVTVSPVVFPNPATDGMQLQLKDVPADEYSLRLISSSGGIIDAGTVKINAGTAPLINTRELTRGLYFLQLAGVHNNFLLRFVVKN